MKRTIALTLAALFTLTAGCRFKSPTVEEQKYLLEKGAFPGGVPPWVTTPTGGGALGGGGLFSGGLIPQTFTGTTLSNSQTGVPAAGGAGSSANVFVAPRIVAPPVKTVEHEPEKDSPLERIATLCPSIESEVSSALITTELRARIRKYESLTTRCPDSWDLWLWLGKDYEKNGEPVKAGRSFERVLVLNNANKEASDLLAENRRKLNAPGSADAPAENAGAQ